MQFICDKGHKFTYSLTRVNNYYNGIGFEDSTKAEFIHPGDHVIIATQTTHHCPFCLTLNISEYQEPETDITSVKSVPLEDVDAWLKEGYVVKELYAKTATLIKRELPPSTPKIEPADPDDPREIQSQQEAQEAYKKLDEATKYDNT